MEENLRPFIFFLTFNGKLTETYYQLDESLKELGFILVPVRMDQLQTLVSATDQSQIIVVSSVMNAGDLKYYQQNVRKSLKLVLRSKRISLMLLTSFARINDSALFNLSKNYFFIRYPIEISNLASQISKYYRLKSAQTFKWPGGKRAGLGQVV